MLCVIALVEWIFGPLWIQSNHNQHPWAIILVKLANNFEIMVGAEEIAEAKGMVDAEGTAYVEVVPAYVVNWRIISLLKTVWKT